MKCKEMQLAALVAVLLLFLAACTSGDGAAASPATPTAAEGPTPTVAAPPPTDVPAGTPSATPTPTPLPISDQDRIDAAIGELDALIASGTAPAELIAYDVIDTTVNDDIVTLTICGWDGQTIDDAIYDAQFRTAADTTRNVTAEELTTPVASGDCQNTHLFDTALDTIDAYEAYWDDIGNDPASFATDERGQQLLEAGYYELSRSFAAGWVEDDVKFPHTSHVGTVRDSPVAPTVYRRSDRGPYLEVATCRTMNTSYGLYSGDALLDDFREPDLPALHAMKIFSLVPAPETATGWQVENRNSTIWWDCFIRGEWETELQDWQPGAAFQEAPQ